MQTADYDVALHPLLKLTLHGLGLWGPANIASLLTELWRTIIHSIIRTFIHGIMKDLDTERTRMAIMPTKIRNSGTARASTAKSKRTQAFDGDVDWEQVLSLLGPRPELVKDCHRGARCRHSSVAAQLDRRSLGTPMEHLSGHRVCPYEYELGASRLVIDGELFFYDAQGKLLDVNDGTAEDLAAIIVESAPSLRTARKRLSP